MKRVEVICRIRSLVIINLLSLLFVFELGYVAKSGLGIKSICAMLANFSSTSLLYQIGTALKNSYQKEEKLHPLLNVIRLSLRTQCFNE